MKCLQEIISIKKNNDWVQIWVSLF